MSSQRGSKKAAQRVVGVAPEPVQSRLQIHRQVERDHVDWNMLGTGQHTNENGGLAPISRLKPQRAQSAKGFAARDRRRLSAPTSASPVSIIA